MSLWSEWNNRTQKLQIKGEVMKKVMVQLSGPELTRVKIILGFIFGFGGLALLLLLAGPVVVWNLNAVLLVTWVAFAIGYTIPRSIMYLAGLGEAYYTSWPLAIILLLGSVVCYLLSSQCNSELLNVRNMDIRAWIVLFYQIFWGSLMCLLLSLLLIAKKLGLSLKLLLKA